MELITKTIMAIIDSVLSLLPQDPFIDTINSLNIPYLNYINYFVPFQTIINITFLWVTAIALFYLYQVFLRNVGAIGS